MADAFSSRPVIIIAPETDLHAQAVRAALERIPSTHCLLWDIGQLCNERHITWRSNGYVIACHGHSISSDNIQSVWWRRPKRVQLLPSLVDPQAKRHVHDSHQSILQAFLYTLGERVINSLESAQQADEKAFQLSAAANCGLDIPSTLITNNYADVVEFTELHGEVVVKPLVNFLGGFPDARIVDKMVVRSHKEEISLCPAIYQQVIAPAHDLRVTIVGDEIFPAEIVKHNPLAMTNIDWRLDPSSECKPAQLEGDLSDKLMGLMKRLRLKYGAIDLRRQLDGRCFFLEVNTAGQYLWVEADTGMPVSQAIARLLATHQP
jgi:glutathione synthase/RimK-type ligase-like ATP-grasp enzyme